MAYQLLHLLWLTALALMMLGEFSFILKTLLPCGDYAGILHNVLMELERESCREGTARSYKY